MLCKNYTTLSICKIGKRKRTKENPSTSDMSGGFRYLMGWLGLYLLCLDTALENCRDYAPYIGAHMPRFSWFKFKFIGNCDEMLSSQHDKILCNSFCFSQRHQGATFCHNFLLSLCFALRALFKRECGCASSIRDCYIPLATHGSTPI